MTLIQGRRRLYYERPFVALSITPSVAPPYSFPLSESGDKLFDQLVGPSETKPPVAKALAAAINIVKYSKDDLQKIFKAVLEA